MPSLTDALPEIDKIKSVGQEWLVGEIAIWQSHELAGRPRDVPTYRREVLHLLPPGASFVALPFRRSDGTDAIAIVLRSDECDVLTGWLREARASDATSMVKYLNREIESGWRYHREQLEIAEQSKDIPIVRPLASGDGPHWLTLEQGHEMAADSPWGRLRVRVSTDGALEFDQWRGRAFHRRIEGRIDAERVRGLFAALDRTTFPWPLQLTFRPGAVAMLKVEPSGDHIYLAISTGMNKDGYREVVSALDELRQALREGKDAVLESWSFVRDEERSAPREQDGL